MIEEFKVKRSLEGSVNNHWHFTASVDGMDYTGHYDGGEIHWFNPKPEEQNISKLEEEVHELMSDYKPLESHMRQEGQGS